MTGSAETGRVVQRPSLICFISAASWWPGQGEGAGGGGGAPPPARRRRRRRGGGAAPGLRGDHPGAARPHPLHRDARHVWEKQEKSSAKN